LHLLEEKMIIDIIIFKAKRTALVSHFINFLFIVKLEFCLQIMEESIAIKFIGDGLPNNSLEMIEADFSGLAR
jgi:hypothetical protein